MENFWKNTSRAKFLKHLQASPIAQWSAHESIFIDKANAFACKHKIASKKLPEIRTKQTLNHRSVRPSFSVPFPLLKLKIYSRQTIAFISFTAKLSTKFTSKPSSKAVLLYETVSPICGIKACVGIKLSAGPGASGTSTHEKSEAKRECERTSARLTNRMPNSNAGVFTIMTSVEALLDRAPRFYDYFVRKLGLQQSRL